MASQIFKQPEGRDYNSSFAEAIDMHVGPRPISLAARASKRETWNYDFSFLVHLDKRFVRNNVAIERQIHDTPGWQLFENRVRLYDIVAPPEISRRVIKLTLLCYRQIDKRILFVAQGLRGQEYSCRSSRNPGHKLAVGGGVPQSPRTRLATNEDDFPSHRRFSCFEFGHRTAAFRQPVRELGRIVPHSHWLTRSRLSRSVAHNDSLAAYRRRPALKEDSDFIFPRRTFEDDILFEPGKYKHRLGHSSGIGDMYASALFIDHAGRTHHPQSDRVVARL